MGRYLCISLCVNHNGIPIGTYLQSKQLRFRRNTVNSTRQLSQGMLHVAAAAADAATDDDDDVLSSIDRLGLSILALRSTPTTTTRAWHLFFNVKP